MPNDSTSSWVLGIIMALLALLGLVMASAAVDPIFYATGLAVSLFGVLFIFFLIKQS
ncbi:MAG: hypothetical protein R3F54_06750 [Alphaproteobacteria bacterium]